MTTPVVHAQTANATANATAIATATTPPSL